MKSKMDTIRIRLPHGVIVRAPGLLPMLYMVSELAGEMKIPDSTLRDWLNGGAPYHRDIAGHVWVDGRAFSAWVLSQRPSKHEPHLAKDEAFCMHCRRVQQMMGVVCRPIRGKLVHVIGTCPECGCTIQRGDRDGK